MPPQLEPIETKRCSRCGRDLPATSEYFYMQPAYKNCSRRLRSECKECWRKRNAAYTSKPESRLQSQRRHREYYAAHREERLAYVKNWSQSHPEQRRQLSVAKERRRRARQAASQLTHTQEDIQAQYDRQGGRCFYCGKTLGDEYETDHVVPLCKGGSDGPENIVVACSKCNRAKHSQHPMDFCGRLL